MRLRASYLLNSSVDVNIELLAVVEADAVVGGGAVGLRGRAGQRQQRHAHVRRARARRVAHSVRPRVLRQSHQPVRAFACHELGLHVILPAGVRLHGHCIILSPFYSWRRRRSPVCADGSSERRTPARDLIGKPGASPWHL